MTKWVRRQTDSKTLVGIRAAHQSKHRATGYGRLCESQQQQQTYIVLRFNPKLVLPPFFHFEQHALLSEHINRSSSLLLLLLLLFVVLVLILLMLLLLRQIIYLRASKRRQQSPGVTGGGDGERGGSGSGSLIPYIYIYIYIYIFKG